MPGPTTSIDAETQLRDMLTAPQYSSPTFTNPSDAADNAYADAPNREAIMHYMATGQMPTTVRPLNRGPIAQLGTLLGLYHPQPQPISQVTMDRAKLAGEAHTQIGREQQLREMAGAAPFVQMYGTDAGRAMMKVIDPRLVEAFPPGLKGKGEIQQEGEELRHASAETANQIKLMQAQTAQAAAEARVALAQGNQALAEQKLQLAQMLGGLAQEKQQTGPIYNLTNSLMTDLRGREESINKRIDALNSLGPVADDDPRMQKLQQQLEEIQGQRTRLLTGAGRAKSVDELLRAMGPMSSGTSTPVATKGYNPLPKGIFGGPAAPSESPPPPAKPPANIPPDWLKRHPPGKKTSTVDLDELDKRAAEIRRRRGY